MRSAPPDGTQAIAVARSANAKIGDAATTYVEQRSCPSSCRFRAGGGCYAEEGAVGKFVTGPLNAAALTVDGVLAPLLAALSEAEAIDGLDVEEGRPLRLHTVGDCSSDLAARVVAAACARYLQRGGGPVWTYTHAWREVDRASWGAVSVLASCETGEDIRAAQARGYATAIVVDEFPSERRYELSEAGRSYPVSALGGDADAAPVSTMPASLSVVPCPQQTRGVTCTDCRLCFDDRARSHAGVSVGFAIHGTALTVRRARMALADPDSPTRRLSSRVLIPALEQRWLKERGRLPSNREVAAELDMNTSSVSEMRRRLREEKAA